MESGKSVEFALRAALVSKGLLGAIGSNDTTVWRLVVVQAVRELRELATLIEEEKNKSKAT